MHSLSLFLFFLLQYFSLYIFRLSLLTFSIVHLYISSVLKNQYNFSTSLFTITSKLFLFIIAGSVKNFKNERLLKIGHIAQNNCSNWDLHHPFKTDIVFCCYRQKSLTYSFDLTFTSYFNSI